MKTHDHWPHGQWRAGTEAFPARLPGPRGIDGSPTDTPHALQGSGFSVHPPSQRRESPTALSAP
jgi:hypothetical protein